MTVDEEEILDQQLEISKDGFKGLEKVIKFCCSGCGLCVSLCPLESIEIDACMHLSVIDWRYSPILLARAKVL